MIPWKGLNFFGHVFLKTIQLLCERRIGWCGPGVAGHCHLDHLDRSVTTRIDSHDLDRSEAPFQIPPAFAKDLAACFQAPESARRTSTYKINQMCD